MRGRRQQKEVQIHEKKSLKWELGVEGSGLSVRNRTGREKVGKGGNRKFEVYQQRNHTARGRVTVMLDSEEGEKRRQFGI